MELGFFILTVGGICGVIIWGAILLYLDLRN